MAFDPVSLVPALCAGLAAALWTNSPARQVARAAGATEVGGPRPAGPTRWGLLRGRPDAAPLRRRLLLASVGALALSLALEAVGGASGVWGWALVPLLVVVGAVVLGRLEPAGFRRRQRRLVQDLPQALELLSACLAAGMPLRRATRAVAASFEGPVADDLDQVLALVDLGVSDAEAWRTLRTHPQWGAAAIDLARSVESGTMMVEVLVHHARDARSHRRADLEVRAKAVGVRSVMPLMTCFLPAFMLIGVVPTVASALLNAIF